MKKLLIIIFVFFVLTNFSLLAQVSVSISVNNSSVCSGSDVTLSVDNAQNLPSLYYLAVFDETDYQVTNFFQYTSGNTHQTFTVIAAHTYKVKIFDRNQNKYLSTTSNGVLVSLATPYKPAINFPSTFCVDNSGAGDFDYTVTNYNPGLTYNFYKVGGGGDDVPAIASSTVDSDPNHKVFKHHVSGKNDNDQSVYYVTSNSSCGVNSDNFTITFRKNSVSEKATSNSPIDVIIKKSEGNYDLESSDIFNNYNSNITWSFTGPTGVKQDANHDWVIDPALLASGTIIPVNQITFSATQNSCTVTGTLTHTTFKIIDDKASLPPFLQTVSAPLPICENWNYLDLYASIDPTCLANPELPIFIKLTYYDTTSKTFSYPIVTANKSKKDPYSSNNLYLFYINPSKHFSNKIPIEILSIAGTCSPGLYKGDIPIYPKTNPSLSGLPTQVRYAGNDYIHLCASSNDTLEMRANPSGGTYNLSWALFDPHAARGYGIATPIAIQDFTIKNFQFPQANDPSLLKFVPSQLYKNYIKPTNDDRSVIIVTYTGVDPCPSALIRYFIFDSPVPNTIKKAKDTICYGDTLLLTVDPKKNLGGKFFYDFGDGTKTDFILNDTIEKHLFKNPGKYIIRFKTQMGSLLPSSTYMPGSCDNDVVDSILIGANPNAKFEVARNFQNLNSRFHSTADIPFPNLPAYHDTIYTWSWQFGDNSQVVSKNPDTMHVYQNLSSDPYKVVHIASTQLGCKDTVTKYIPVFPIKTPKQKSPEVDSFQVFNPIKPNGWFQSGQYKIDTVSSWMNIKPDGSVIKSENEAWFTWKNNSTVNSGYFNNDSSYVESPVYCLDSLVLPMVSLDTWTNMDNLFDGASLQYTFCDSIGFGTENWHTLGNLGQGLNWYTSNTILGSPGNENRGWTNDTSKAWQLSAYRLDQLINPTNKKLLRFRVVLGTNNDNTPGKKFDGFAFDNFFVGQRNRKVIVEEFCDFERYIDTIDKAFKDPQALRIQYHVSDFTNDGKINWENKADPGARSLLYGVGSALPLEVVDGVHLYQKYGTNNSTYKKDMLGWSVNEFFKRSLELSPFNISVNANVNKTTKAIDITSTIAKVADLNSKKNYVVQMAVVERMVKRDQIEFTNVLRSLLPNAAGNRIDQSFDWINLKEKSYSTSWRPSVKPDSGFYIIVFIQDEDTKEIYQSSYDSISFAETDFLSTVRTLGVMGSSVSFNEVYLSPNPTSGDLKITFNGILNEDYHFIIFDALGNEHKSGFVQAGSNMKFFNTEELNSGVYYLRIEGEGQAVVKKFSVIK